MDYIFTLLTFGMREGLTFYRFDFETVSSLRLQRISLYGEKICDLKKSLDRLAGITTPFRIIETRRFIDKFA